MPSLASRPAIGQNNHVNIISDDSKQLFSLLRVDTDEKSEDGLPV